MVRRFICSVEIFGPPQYRPCENVPVDGDDKADHACLTHPFNTLCDRVATTELRQALGLTAITSSTGLLVNEYDPIAVTCAVTARTTATSPSGSTAWTLIGEMITYSENMLFYIDSQ